MREPIATAVKNTDKLGRYRGLDRLLEVPIAFCFAFLNSSVFSLAQTSSEGAAFKDKATRYNAWLLVVCGTFGVSLLFFSCLWHLFSKRAKEVGRGKIFEEHLSGKRLPLFISFMILLIAGAILLRMLATNDVAQNEDRVTAVNKLLILAGYLTGFDVTHENSASQHQEIASLQRTVTALSLRDISAHARAQAPAEKSKKKKSEFRFLIDQLLAMRNSQLAGKATSFIDASVKSITKFSLLRNDAISDLIYGCFGLFVSFASVCYDFISGRAAVIGARKVFASHCSGKSAQIMLTFLLSTAAGIIRLAVLNASEEKANENVLILAAVFSGLAGFLGNARMDSLPGRVGQFFSENGSSDHAALPVEPSTAEEELPRIAISAPIVHSEDGTPLASSRHVTHLIPPAPAGRHCSN